MVSRCHYGSPLGGILLAADEIGLTGLWFDGEKYFADHLPSEHTERETPILVEVKRWLDIYFAGKEPDFLPPLHPIGSAFRQSVWEILLQIPYGKTTTYGEIARQLAEKRKLPRMSAQAVGGAVGHNEISIIISWMPMRLSFTSCARSLKKVCISCMSLTPHFGPRQMLSFLSLSLLPKANRT